jgi:hypothetical protein
MRIIILSILLAGCASGTSRLCGSDWLCEQALMKKGDYKTSSQNPYPIRPTRIEELRHNQPTGRIYEVKR